MIRVNGWIRRAGRPVEIDSGVCAHQSRWICESMGLAGIICAIQSGTAANGITAQKRGKHHRAGDVVWLEGPDADTSRVSDGKRTGVRDGICRGCGVVQRIENRSAWGSIRKGDLERIGEHAARRADDWG